MVRKGDRLNFKIMFRSGFREFEDDPFFRDHQQRMAVFNGFGDPFSSFGFPSTRPAIDNGDQRDRSLRNNQQLAPHDMFGSMFGSMFANMNSMMANMHQNFERMANDPNTYSYSSSTVMSYSNDGRGDPKYFQASKSTKRAPGGVKETQHAVRDSESGLHRMAIGHHLGDRSHVIERSMNRRTGEEERKQDFINLDENDAAAFDREWRQRTKQSSQGLRDRHRPHVRALGDTDHRTGHAHHVRHAGVAPAEEERSVRHNRVERERDWGQEDHAGVAERSQRNKSKRDKHVRLNSRPVNRHEPRSDRL